MRWSLTDRAQVVALCFLLLVVAVTAVPILAGSSYLPLLAIAAVSVVAAWRVSLARTVEVVIDADAISKTIGTHTWQLSWSEIGSARLKKFLGSDQVVLVGPVAGRWSASDRLFTLVPRGAVAVQVPSGRVDELRRLLVTHGLMLADPDGSAAR